MTNLILESIRCTSHIYFLEADTKNITLEVPFHYIKTAASLAQKLIVPERCSVTFSSVAVFEVFLRKVGEGDSLLAFIDREIVPLDNPYGSVDAYIAVIKDEENKTELEIRSHEVEYTWRLNIASLKAGMKPEDMRWPRQVPVFNSYTHLMQALNR